jgi:hypothetical protein
MADGIVPAIIWVVLFGGAFLTVGFTFFFGAENLRAQSLMTGALSILIFAGLLTVVAIDYPFAGTVKSDRRLLQPWLRISRGFATSASQCPLFNSRTSRPVRLESAKWAKADLGSGRCHQSRFCEYTPKARKGLVSRGARIRRFRGALLTPIGADFLGV